MRPPFMGRGAAACAWALTSRVPGRGRVQRSRHPRNAAGARLGRSAPPRLPAPRPLAAALPRGVLAPARPGPRAALRGWGLLGGGGRGTVRVLPTPPAPPRTPSRYASVGGGERCAGAPLGRTPGPEVRAPSGLGPEETAAGCGNPVPPSGGRAPGIGSPVEFRGRGREGAFGLLLWRPFSAWP